METINVYDKKKKIRFVGRKALIPASSRNGRSHAFSDNRHGGIRKPVILKLSHRTQFGRKKRRNFLRSKIRLRRRQPSRRFWPRARVLGGAGPVDAPGAGWHVPDILMNAYNAMAEHEQQRRDERASFVPSLIGVAARAAPRIAMGDYSGAIGQVARETADAARVAARRAMYLRQQREAARLSSDRRIQRVLPDRSGVLTPPKRPRRWDQEPPTPPPSSMHTYSDEGDL